VVITKNYHPNMVLLFYKFKAILGITEANQYDNFDLLCANVGSLQEAEANIVKDVFAIAIAFDGKISNLEMQSFAAIFGQNEQLYKDRLQLLTNYLRKGALNAAWQLCKINEEAG
jgi:hypothetical protein